MNQRPAIKSTFPVLHVLDASAPSEPLETDADLLSEYLATGNRVPMESLMRRYSPMVASVCRSTISDPSAAEDAFQATFLVFLRSAKRIRKQSSVGAWLHGVAYRTSCRLRQQRCQQRRRQFSLEALPEVACTPVDPLAQIARQMELEVLDQELQVLPLKLRDALVEHFLLGHSASKIAERMDLSTSAVEGRIRRGKLKLRSRLSRRGVSFSAAFAAACWFQEPVHATEAGSWLSELLNGSLAQWTTGSSVLSSPKLEVSTLVNGELAMLNSTAAKALLVTSLVVGVGAVIAFNPDGLGKSSNAAADDAPIATTLQVVSADESATFLSQIAPASQSGPAKATTPSAAARGTTTSSNSAMPAKSAKWSRPDSGTPEWLQSGAEQQAAVEENRKVLRKQVELDFNGTPLRHVLSQIMDDLSIAIYVNQSEIDAFGADIDAPITLTMPRVSLRSAFRLILTPLDLTYKIHENYIEITSIDNADAVPTIRYYDLSHVMTSAANAESLIRAIENTCAPDAWLAAGGKSSISVVGSLMIVASIEETHSQIEALLANVARILPQNLAAEVNQGDNNPKAGLQLPQSATSTTNSRDAKPAPKP